MRIILRADSGFAREELMAWCETNDVEFLFGLAQNSRLNVEIAADLAAAAEASVATGKPARRFKDFKYRTLDSWSRERRVIGKAEWMTPSLAEADDTTQRRKKKKAKKARKAKAVAPPAILLPGRANPRFIVTSLKAAEHEARALYEKRYCARGEMENRIKECQLNPATPSCMKRSCQRQTTVLSLPTARVMALVPWPSAVSSTIPARQTCFCGLLRSRTIASNRTRSAGVTAMDIPLRIAQCRTKPHRAKPQMGVFR